MTVPVITPLPPAPTRADAPSDFTAKADAFVAAQVGMVAEFNASAEFVDQRAADANESAQAAASSQLAVEQDRAIVVQRADEVALNTAIVNDRAGEAATNAQQVATDRLQVAADAQAVADALASIADGPVTSVNGKTGVVELSAADIGLGNVDNTRDADKDVLSATKLATPRLINGVPFDGTQDIETGVGSVRPVHDAGSFGEAGSDTVVIDVSLHEDTVVSLNTANTTGTLTVQFDSVPEVASGSVVWYVEFIRGGRKSITWSLPAGLSLAWAGGVAPVLGNAVDARDMIMFERRLGRSTIVGTLIAAGSI